MLHSTLVIHWMASKLMKMVILMRVFPRVQATAFYSSLKIIFPVSKVFRSFCLHSKRKFNPDLPGGRNDPQVYFALQVFSNPPIFHEIW